MPVAAPALAHVLVGDPHPAIALRIGDHRFEDAPVGLLDVDAGGEFRLCLAQAKGQRVPNPLQLLDAEHARAADCAHSPVDPLPGKRGGEHLAEAKLQAPDLGPEVLANAAFRVRTFGAELDLERGSCGLERDLRWLAVQ